MSEQEPEVDILWEREEPHDCDCPKVTCYHQIDLGFRIEGYGATLALVDNSNEKNRAMYRRVEIGLIN